MTVHTTWVGATAILSLDNPPVNAGNTAMRRDLRDALLAVRREPGLRAVVVESAGRHFYAGADIGEFDRPLEEPQLPAVIEVIEELEVPVVAAITGFALGGGLELALGCDARVGDTSAIVGFPEVTLGIIPGSGGTVRGGRLLGPARAIDLVASGRHVAVDEALELGILDEVVEPEQLRDAAVRRAEGMGGKRRLRDLPGPEFDAAEVGEVEHRVSRRARPNVLDAIEMVKRGVAMPAADALREERAVFNRLRLGDESANLRYLFFAKRKAGAGLRTGAAPRRIECVGVAGAGTMGAAIARLFDRSGYGVTVFDLDEDALRRVAESAPGIATTQRLADLADAGLVIDAVFEDMGVKQDLLREIERVAPADAILASNTSYLDLDEMSGVLQHPERFAGLHFFNPADRNPLIEVVRPARADDETIATLGALTGKLGKTAVLAGVGEGFVANRVYADYRAQAEFLLEEGASPEDVDAAMVDLGFPIGPFAVGDMSGLDIAWARRKRLSAHRDPLQRYVTIPDSLCESGRFGKKAGAGWYAYPEGASRGVPDARVTEIIEDARRAKGIAPREISGEEIQLRVVASMLCAAAALLRDGIARQASDIDVAMTEGFGFPKRLGGPLRFAASLPEDRLLHWLAVVHESDPTGFRIAQHDGRIPEPIRRVLDEVTGA